MEETLTIGEYLIQRLTEKGVRHVFGIPGDYVLGFYGLLDQSELQIINTCDEQGAGFAADAYARVRGLGVVVITYCVGGLKVANPTAEAYAEKSPVVVISGAPGTKEREKNPLLHHKVKEFDTQLKVFEQITCATAVLNDPETAFREIDRVLGAAGRYKRPVYIELPRDMVSTRGVPNHHSPEPAAASDPDSLEEAVAEARVMINEAEKPVILAGVELHRFGLQDALVELLRKTNIPVAATLQSKSVLGERHPLFLGIYEGAMGREDVREYVETSDCLILLGALMSDVDLGIFTARLDPSRSIYVTSEKSSIRFHNYENIRLEDFLRSLLRADLVRRELVPIPHAEAPGPFTPVPREKITVQRLFQRLNAFLEDDTIVIADPGEALFASADLYIHGRTEFLAPAYYTSMGFGVPAALGAQLADPRLRPLVLVGDGAFQMTGMELSTIARFGLSPIVVVLNNRGYTTERPMQDGSFNDLLEWKYNRIPEILGSGKGFEVETEGDLETALRFSHDYTQGFCLLDVHLDPFDTSRASKRLTSALAKKVH